MLDLLKLSRSDFHELKYVSKFRLCWRSRSQFSG
jgi:hypothetical protein